ncbi:hypothetical protein HK407_04g08050 [Ordospora pajunii]|uniref:uncharacterized protein n=1 Tax=Ordospora pajunii TaxID=3039483 RepID=UPI0029528DC0|nr:uncharacterized protein HK407_04g08050 [Ordospora pajunii]KAH9411695.1 hypothetical protein HK407_04g08050 [Ordospora pajunii]
MEDRVYIVHRQIEKIPEISGRVKAVDLHRNRISEMVLSRVESMEYLDLSDNRIAEINDLENVPNLKVLDLSYNLISTVEIPVMNLEELYLISNDIPMIHGLELPMLRKLDMAANEICRIENLEGCRSLAELYLGSNRIREVDGLDDLCMLKTLDLQNNDILRVDCLKIPRSVEVLLLGENVNLEQIDNIEALCNLRILGIEKTRVLMEAHEGKFEVWK